MTDEQIDEMMRDLHQYALWIEDVVYDDATSEAVRLNHLQAMRKIVREALENKE